MVLAGFVPGPSPSTSAAHINERYLHNLGGIRAGMCIEMAAIALIAPWGAALAVQTHRGNPGTAVFTVTQIVCVAVTTIIGVLAPIAWGFASFRAGSQSPELTQTLNDLAWIVFIFPWSPLAVWYASVGLAIIMDRSDQPVFPRWAAYLSFWTATLSARQPDDPVQDRAARLQRAAFALGPTRRLRHLDLSHDGAGYPGDPPRGGQRRGRAARRAIEGRPR